MTIPEAHVYRSTPQRDAILHVVREARDHPTARDVWERVQRHRPGIGVATVYRTLDLLAANGMVLALQLGDDAIARYDGNVAAHDHVVCEVCGVIADVTVPLPDGTVQAVEEDTGFAIRGSELQFRGVCPGCR